MASLRDSIHDAALPIHLPAVNVAPDDGRVAIRPFLSNGSLSDTRSNLDDAVVFGGLSQCRFCSQQASIGGRSRRFLGDVGDRGRSTPCVSTMGFPFDCAECPRRGSAGVHAVAFASISLFRATGHV